MCDLLGFDRNKVNMNLSERTKKIMSLALAQKAAACEETDSEVNSDDSYIPDETTILPPVLDEEVSHDDESDSSDIILDGHYSHVVIPQPPTPSFLSHQSMDVSSDEEDIVPARRRGVVRRIVESEGEDSERDYDADSEENEAVTYFGKKKCFAWSSVPQRHATQAASHNVIKVRLQKLKGPALTLGTRPSPEEVWRLFITREMVEKIVEHTNAKLANMRLKLDNQDLCYKDTDPDELDALLGLLLFCSIFKSSREPLSSLFSTSTSGRPIFRAIMTEKRCCVLLRALRFDDSATRDEREKKYKGACISEFFNALITNCKENYEPGAHMTVDETLVSFRGRVSFLVYNPQKPAKYGLKIMVMTDAHNAYMYNAYLYTGKGSDGYTLSADDKKLLIPSQAVVRLAKDIFGSHRNITCDNWFVSVELAQVLLKNGLTLVGTMKKNKPQIPPEFQPSKERDIPSSIYGFTEDLTLLSFAPKKMKAVMLLSSMHHSAYTDKANSKPEIISFYNATKGGVDTLDFKCSNYCANRKTRRWPLVIFYHLLAVTGSNAHILHKMYQHNKATTRFDFTRAVAFGLIFNQLQKRLQIINLPTELKAIISETHKDATNFKRLTEKRLPPDGTARKETPTVSERNDKLERRLNCKLCPYQKKRRAGYKCIKCDTPVCGECSRKICKDCVQ